MINGRLSYQPSVSLFFAFLHDVRDFVFLPLLCHFFQNDRNFGADFDSISLVRALGLEIGYFNGKFEPLSDPIEIRGYIQLPGEVETDTESPLSIRFAGEEFVLR